MTFESTVNSGGNYINVNDIDPDSLPDVTDYAKTVEGLGTTIGDVSSRGADKPNAMRGEYIPPKVREARRQARALPFKEEKLRDLSNRVSRATSFGSVPKDVHEAAVEAGDAIRAARDALGACRDPEMPNYANGDPEAREAAVVALGRAEMVVRNVERVARDSYGEIRDGIVAGLADQQEAAREALKEALTAYATWRRAIQQASALGTEMGIHGPAGSWAVSDEAKKVGDPLKLIDGIDAALKVAKSDDAVVNGQWLTTVADEEGIPEYLAEYLKTVAKQGDPDRWDVQVARRLLSPHREDYPARESIATRDLRVINSQPVPAGIYDVRAKPAGDVAGIRDMRAETAPRTPQKSAYVSQMQPDGSFKSIPWAEAQALGLVD